MTKEEAINICRLALKCFANKQFNDNEEAVTYLVERYDLEMMLNSLEKQIPTKPLDFGDESYLCPYCKRNNFYKGEYLDKQNYCDFCGQRINWRGDTDESKREKGKNNLQGLLPFVGRY